MVEVQKLEVFCAEQLAQSHLRKATCAEQLAQSTCTKHLRRATCTDQLAQSTCAKRLRGATGAAHLRRATCSAHLRRATCSEHLRRATCTEHLRAAACRATCAQQPGTMQLAQTTFVRNRAAQFVQSTLRRADSCRANLQRASCAEPLAKSSLRNCGRRVRFAIDCFSFCL